MKQFSKFVGLDVHDVHKDTIAVAVSEANGGSTRYYGEIPNTPKALAKLGKTLTAPGDAVSFCDEAGPCGYGIYRHLTALGQACAVVAPSLIPTKPGNRVKTDRRDSESLSRLHRAGELTAVWVPDPEQEAMRDLTRAREEMKGLERIAKQRLNAFLLRHGRIYARGKCRWTQAPRRWLEGLKFESAVQQIVFQEYIEAVKQAAWPGWNTRWRMCAANLGAGSRGRGPDGPARGEADHRHDRAGRTGGPQSLDLPVATDGLPGAGAP